jgi:NAD(P)-dependent dehydrogenase (short-subunit alcohol dehydrogenase family)
MDANTIQVAGKFDEPMKLSKEASYLLAGGFGGLGRSISRWMARHGAKHLIFVSRKAGTSVEAKQLLDELKA